MQLAKILLADNGVIFISIDDNEQVNLKLICDDVFWEQNFAGQIVVVNNLKGLMTELILQTVIVYPMKSLN